MGDSKADVPLNSSLRHGDTSQKHPPQGFLVNLQASLQVREASLVSNCYCFHNLRDPFEFCNFPEFPEPFNVLGFLFVFALFCYASAPSPDPHSES